MAVLYQGVIIAPAMSNDRKAAPLAKAIRAATGYASVGFKFSDQRFDFKAYFQKGKASQVNYVYEHSEHSSYICSSDPASLDRLFSSIPASRERHFLCFVLPHIATRGDLKRYQEAINDMVEHCNAIEEVMQSGRASFESAVEGVLHQVPRGTSGLSNRLSVWNPDIHTSQNFYSSPFADLPITSKPASQRNGQRKLAIPMPSPTMQPSPESPANNTAHKQLKQDCKATDTLLSELQDKLDDNTKTISELQYDSHTLTRAVHDQHTKVEALQKELQTEKSTHGNAMRAMDDLRIELGKQLTRNDETIKSLQTQLEESYGQSPSTQHQDSSSPEDQPQTMVVELDKPDRRIAQLESEVRQLKDDMLKKFYQLEEERDKVKELEARISRGTKRSRESMA